MRFFIVLLFSSIYFFMFTIQPQHIFIFFDFYVSNTIFHLHIPSHCHGFTVEWALWVRLHGLAHRFGLGREFCLVLRLILFLCCGPISPLWLIYHSPICYERHRMWKNKIKDYPKAGTHCNKKQNYNMCILYSEHFLDLCMMINIRNDHVQDADNITCCFDWLRWLGWYTSTRDGIKEQQCFPLSLSHTSTLF